MGSGCGDSIVDRNLRPPGKLPVPVALNALSPTLFTDYYTRFDRKCKYLFYRYYRINCLPEETAVRISRIVKKVSPGFCRIFLPASLLFSAVFPTFRTYNVTT